MFYLLPSTFVNHLADSIVHILYSFYLSSRSHFDPCVFYAFSSLRFPLSLLELDRGSHVWAFAVHGLALNSYSYALRSPLHGSNFQLPSRIPTLIGEDVRRTGSPNCQIASRTLPARGRGLGQRVSRPASAAYPCCKRSRCNICSDTETCDSLSSSEYGPRATGGYTINNALEEPDLCAMVRCRPRYFDWFNTFVWLDALDVEDEILCAQLACTIRWYVRKRERVKTLVWRL